MAWSVNGKWGIDLLIWDRNGMVLDAAIWGLQCIDEASVPEELGTRLWIVFAWEMLFLSLTVESYALMSILALQKRIFPNSCMGFVLLDCSSLKAHFDKVVYSHIGRVGNNSVHYLAKYAFCHPNHVWIEEIPPIIGHCILEDFCSWLNEFRFLEKKKKLSKGYSLRQPFSIFITSINKILYDISFFSFSFFGIL